MLDSIKLHTPPPTSEEWHRLTCRLCHCNIFPVIWTKTKKYCSPIYFCLANYQEVYFVFYLHLLCSQFLSHLHTLSTAVTLRCKKFHQV